MPTPDVRRQLWGLVLAAGAGPRFGSPKPLAAYLGESLVVRAARLMLGCCPAGVGVVTGASGAEVAAALAAAITDPALRVVPNPAWAEGMATSLRSGLLAAPGEALAVLVMPCDLPAVTACDLALLVAAWADAPARIVAADFPGGPGPPAILPRGVWSDCAGLTGDQGARSLIRQASDRHVVPMPAAAWDVDTPADLARLGRRAMLEQIVAGRPLADIANLGGRDPMAQVQVEYFAILREHAGRDRESLVTDAATLGDLYAELDRRYRFPSMGRLKVAVNDEFREWTAPLRDGDLVVFIPPVAGG
jgi:molybdenum cofactor cytidylyltransferase